jgi:transglutaminase/protease-like cytokinesis protein 3
MKDMGSGIESEINTGSIFNIAARNPLSAEELGISSRAHAQLMHEQAEWKFHTRGNEPFAKLSPLLQKQMETQALQDNLKMSTSDFALLMKRQSQWENQVENGETRVSSSPVAQAQIARLQPTETKLDFGVQKNER